MNTILEESSNDSLDSGISMVEKRESWRQSSTSPFRTTNMNRTTMMMNNVDHSNQLLMPVINRRPSSSSSNLVMNGDSLMNQMCTLYTDMSFDDRIFFGVHNFFLLKCSLSENQCNVDFSANNNKVSIIGKAENVAKICKSFFLHSTFALQFEFYFFDETTCADYMKERFPSVQKEYEQWDVYISYRPEKPNILLFTFLTFRKFFVRLIQSMINFQMQLEFYQLGRVMPNFMSTLQIPITRREGNLINSNYLESIEHETGTKIKLIRYHDCHHYPFGNVIITGVDILSVIQARWLITTRFEYELKFQVTISDISLLVKCISSLNYDRSLIEVTISPCASNPSLDSKILSIKTNEKHIDKIFSIHKELIDSMMINGIISKH